MPVLKANHLKGARLQEWRGSRCTWLLCGEEVDKLGRLRAPAAKMLAGQPGCARLLGP